MKGLRLILSVCLGATYFYGAWADIDGDAARAAARRGTSTMTTTSTQTRQKPTTTHTNSAAATRDASPVANRAVSTGATATQSRSAINMSTRENAVTSRGAATGAVVSRGAANTVTPRANTVTSNASRVATRGNTTATSTSRVATPITRTSNAATRQSRAAANTTARAAITNATPRRTSAPGGAARQSRAATTTGTTAPGNYKECRTVYYECMDEFCANKDAQLRRCACSARMSEFDGLKEQMTRVEDKLLDFNQRLLTVNMDKEDALAINTATEGELAFNQTDKSDSKKMLDDISKKLNNTFNNSKLDNDLSAISLSLDMDSAFDNLDSMMGADTVAKSGTALYSAALPVCREMAAEVCSDDELSIAESGYQMMIEQDCNTVAKAYSTQAETAREKIREGGALLDMSRLNIHQTRNSDDILTCKAKMLDMLSDTTVCGENLGKCLDTSGQYIDPTTGAAFLSSNLSQLATLITRPTADQTWTSAPGNEKFVTFLNSKKKFLAPAMENCQDIADAVWDAFIEDALAQIKLAQNAKLEDMRQSCTQLVAECMTDTAKSISEFDARALSIFGVTADKTVREMCSAVQTACTALLDNTSGSTDWGTGIDQIATDKSYETLLYTCREVGKNCIIQACKSTSGNFGLCTDIQTSVNRKSIVNRRACWDEVRACISAAGPDTLKKITNSLTGSDDITYFYTDLYGGVTVEDGDKPIKLIPNPQPASTQSTCISDEYKSIFDICAKNCANTASLDCIECRLTERIWGNCENNPTETIAESEDGCSSEKIYSNRILMTGSDRKGTDTLLSWFAANTNTSDKTDSCRDTSCGSGMILHNGSCVPSGSVTDSDEVCNAKHQFDVTENQKHTNCCPTETAHTQNYEYARCGGNKDSVYVWYNMPGFLNASEDSRYYNNETISKASASTSGDNTGTKAIYLPTNDTVRVDVCWIENDSKYCLVCIGGNDNDTKPTNCRNGSSGEYFIVDAKGHVLSPKEKGVNYPTDSVPTAVKNYFKTKGPTCTYQYACTKMKDKNTCAEYGWTWSDSPNNSDNNTCTEPTHWTIQYGGQ